ncbi:MAG TPA: tetratricopeptide repeat protein [Xanthobacteraceae bacterium]|nr:tetratricopeptide repeat protein [Xanthobacteraceae bacterium]
MVRGICVAAACIIGLGAVAIAGDADLELCKSDANNSDVIAACDRVIARGNLSKEDLYSAYYERGMKRRGNRQFDQAISDFTAAIAVSPKTWAYVARGHAYAYKKDFARAFADQEKAIAMEATEVTYTGRAMDLIEAGAYDRAIADLNEALRINNKYLYGYLARGDAYLKKREFDKAGADYQAALQIKPDNQEAKNGIKRARAHQTN